MTTTLIYNILLLSLACLILRVDCEKYDFPLGAGSESSNNNNQNGVSNPNGNNDNNQNNNGDGVSNPLLNFPGIPKPSADLKAQWDKARKDHKLDMFNSDAINNMFQQFPDPNKDGKNIKNKVPDMDILFGKAGKDGSLGGVNFPLDPNAIRAAGAAANSKSSVDWTTFSFVGFWPSLSMIIVSEIGDKTFFIAAIMAMKHSRLVVWLGAAGALAVMTVLAVVCGSLLQVIPSWITHYGAGMLFLLFGIKLLWEAKNMKGGEALDELKEAEEELLEAERKDKEKQMRRRHDSNDVELGQVHINGSNKDVDIDTEYKKKMTSGWNFSILIRAFMMTFVSEIGDRSQITTVVLAAHRNPYGVTIGATLGHAICTAIAVLGGKLLASKVSEKNVTLIGGILFLAFSLECFVYGPA